MANLLASWPSYGGSSGASYLVIGAQMGCQLLTMKPKNLSCQHNRGSTRVVTMPLRPAKRVPKKRWFKYFEMFSYLCVGNAIVAP